MTYPADSFPTRGPEDEVPRFAAPGVRIAGRYRLARRIAGGGMGEVWRAHDRILDAPVAIKLLRAEYLEEPMFLARLRAEARLAGMLDHRGIAAIMDYGEHDGPAGSAWLVMELVEGEPLGRLLARFGKLPAEQTLHIIGQAALALHAAHAAGVVHRDVKPGNILVQPDGLVKITDFGIARAMGSVPLTRTGTVLGTAHYLSPEQACGAAATPASDIYALSVVAYECLAGHRPFDGEGPVQVALAHQRAEVPPLPEELPAPVVGLVMRALAKDPAHRPSSAGSMGRTALGIRQALYLDGPGDGRSQPSAHRPARPAAPATASRRRRRGLGRWARPVQMIGVVGAIAIGAVVIANTGDAESAGSKAPAPQTPLIPQGISVDPAQFRGRPVASVIADLTALGLLTRRSNVVAPGIPDTVITIVGADGGPLPATLTRGSTVVLQVVTPASAVR